MVLPAAALTFAAFAHPSAVAGAAPDVRGIWLADCAVCHGADGHGTTFAPALDHVGRASVDYELSTGRMPLAAVGRNERSGRARQPLPSQHSPEPDRRAARHSPAYDRQTIGALVDFVGRLVADGGPPVPALHAGDVAQGGVLYRQNCAACHSWSGDGGALLHREAPQLHDATGVQIAEAVRIGPGQMPSFGSAALTPRQLDDLVAYVDELDHPNDRGGLALRHLGPVAEGAVGLVALAAIVWLCLWIGDRSSERRET